MCKAFSCAEVYLSYIRSRESKLICIICVIHSRNDGLMIIAITEIFVIAIIKIVIRKIEYFIMIQNSMSSLIIGIPP